jgi:hypothetical protein
MDENVVLSKEHSDSYFPKGAIVRDLSCKQTLFIKFVIPVLDELVSLSEFPSGGG